MVRKKELAKEVVRLDIELDRLRQEAEKATALMRSCCSDLDGVIDALAPRSPYRFPAQSVRDRIAAALALLDVEVKAPGIATVSVTGTADVGGRSVRDALELAGVLAQIVSLPVTVGAWLAPLAETAARTEVQLVVVREQAAVVERQRHSDAQRALEAVKATTERLHQRLTDGPRFPTRHKGEARDALALRRAIYAYLADAQSNGPLARWANSADGAWLLSPNASERIALRDPVVDIALDALADVIALEEAALRWRTG